MKRFTTLFSLLFLMAFGPVNAQYVQRVCGHDLILDQARTARPDFDAYYNRLFSDALDRGSQLRQGETEYTVQVVFHILYNPDDPYTQISDELIQSQLDALNRDFNKRNADTSETRDIFKPLARAANIRFVLAKKKGNNCQNAIIRKEWEAPDVFLPIYGDVVIKNDDFGGSTAWNTNLYLNIWVADLNPDPAAEGFLGGYAFLPGLANSIPLLTPKSHDGVVIDYRFFGQGNPYIEEVQPGFSIYNKGRTTVHEVGHWLGLRHIWGDLGTLIPEQGCNADDGIDDTPNAAVPYSLHGFCQDTIVNSCNDGPGDLPDMFENYMDYSSDECNSMYTIQQVDVFHGTLTGYRAALQTNIYPEPTTATITAAVTESTTGQICFELEECYGIGARESFFCDGDSSLTTELGSASLIEGQLCIEYTAGIYGENNTDEFCLVTYNEHFDEYDTTIFQVEIEEQCPKTQTTEVALTENTSETICIGRDACSGGGSFTVSVCGGGSSYTSDVVTATVSDTCIDIAALGFDPEQTTDQLCVISDLGGGIFDTTYIDVTIEEGTTTGIHLSAEDNAISTYPNPTEGRVLISTAPLTEHVSLVVFDPLGSVVRSYEMQRGQRQLEIDLTGLAPGAYLLYFEGKKVSTFEKVLLK